MRRAAAWTLGPLTGPALLTATSALMTAALMPAATALAAPVAAQPEPYDGVCLDGAGATLVVDQLDTGAGGLTVRCVPGPLAEGTSGLDVLRAAGFTVEGVSRWGDAFVCRIDGAPAPDQELDLDSDPGYRESCLDTPPTQASWAYWEARADTPWTYVTAGARAHAVADGDILGWVFAVDPGADPTMPRFDPETGTTTTPAGTSQDVDPAGGPTGEPASTDDGAAVESQALELPTSVLATVGVIALLGVAGVVASRRRREEGGS